MREEILNPTLEILQTMIDNNASVIVKTLGNDETLMKFNEITFLYVIETWDGKNDNISWVDGILGYNDYGFGLHNLALYHNDDVNQPLIFVIDETGFILKNIRKTKTFNC